MNKKAFTLVELIVTMSILVILGSIAFLSFTGYSRGARDSVRISDISLISTSVEVFRFSTSFYPETSLGSDVTYGGAEAWTQGTFGEATRNLANKINKVPKDPLTGNEYVYSRTWNRHEYEISSIFEGILGSNGFVTQANADGKTKAVAYVKGNYNGRVLKVMSGSTAMILTIPSIINSDMSLLDIQDILDSQSFVYDGYLNLPDIFKDSDFDVSGGFAFNPSDIIAFNGDIQELVTNESLRIQVIKSIQEIYSDTIVSSEPGIKELLDLGIINANIPNDRTREKTRGLINPLVGIDLPRVTGTTYDSPIANSCLEMTDDNVDVLNSELGIYIGGDKIKAEWCGLTAINIFDEVGLTRIPAEIGNLKNLDSLHLTNNNLSKLSSSLVYLTNLNVLDLSGNPLLGNLNDTFNKSNTANLLQTNITELGQDMTIATDGAIMAISITQ